MNELARKKCAPCEGGVAPLDSEQVRLFLKGLQGWSREGAAIAKTFRFADHFETMAFVNAVAWISHRENHHPDMVVGYDRCVVSYVTHAIDGLSENDFICAAKIDALFEL
ncbi:MAG TPA: 4a-hydroxytetrahydrobiopterin dehydratase [Usitatibacter sp.]|nr:4a-hydroxytetrahydrobiopterin dehydratase [Usitatibacter sp.]